jgi:RNA recognition motif-containing protein
LLFFSLCCYFNKEGKYHHLITGVLMSRKLYVGNIPFSATEDQLKDLFSQFGTVESVIIMKDNGRSRGFGFVEMSSEDEASRAAENLDGTELGGRSLKVNLARPKEFRSDSRGGNGGGGFRGGRDRDRRRDFRS